MSQGLAAAFGLLSALTVLLALHMARGIAPLFAVMAAAALILHLVSRRYRPEINHSYLAGLAALCLWSLVSAFWAFDPMADGMGALRLCLLMLGGVFLVSAARRLEAGQARLFRRFFVAAYAAMLVLIAFDLLSGMQVIRLSYALRGLFPPDGFNFGPETKHRVVLMAILLPPAFLAARREWGQWAALALATGVTLLVGLHKSETSYICLIGIFAVAPFGFWLPNLARRLGIAALALLFLAPPLLHDRLPTPLEIQRAHPWLTPSLLHRILIWDYALGRISERPLLGFGFDAAREIGGREPKRHYYFDDLPNGMKLHPYFEPIPLHTHNGVVQIWLELGAVGAAIGGLLLMLAWKGALLKQDPWQRAGSAALYAAIMAPVLSSYGLFQNWWVGTVWIAIAALEAQGRT